MPGTGQCQNPPLTSRSTGRQKRGAFGSLRLRYGAGYLSVNGQALVSFWLVLCKGLGIRLAAKPPVLVMAKAGKVAVRVGCQHHRQHGYSRRAPVAGPSRSNGNRVGAVCALVPFAIRWGGASCSGECIQRWVPGETLVVIGH